MAGARTVACYALVVVLSWYLMMVFNELGHIVSVAINGGTIERVVLWPWMFSQTIRSGSRHEILDIWAGPVFGIAIPLVLSVVAERIARRPIGCVRFFAGFCLVANGVYIGAGAIAHIGDAGELLDLGFPVWPIVLFGAACIAGGLFVWHKAGTATGSLRNEQDGGTGRFPWSFRSG
ncbi:MAG: hypothetical protein JW889_01215 [Verrucomicrobia bacterium]|nr:hypothetical protein [Verrucomicrobiota bacterium]